jgi:hypothetical protein
VILVFGTRASEAVLAIVAFACSFCGVSAPQSVVKRVVRFTLFFIPLFPVATSYRNECSNCGGITALSRAQAEHSAWWAATRGTV